MIYVVFYNSSYMVLFDYFCCIRDMLDWFMGVDIFFIGGKFIDFCFDGEKVFEIIVGGVVGNGIDV